MSHEQTVRDVNGERQSLCALRAKAGPGSFSVAGARYVVALETRVAALEKVIREHWSPEQAERILREASE